MVLSHKTHTASSLWPKQSNNMSSTIDVCHFQLFFRPVHKPSAWYRVFFSPFSWTWYLRILSIFTQNYDQMYPIYLSLGAYMVAKSFQALRNVSSFDFRSCHRYFSMTCMFQPLCCYQVESASKRNDYHEYLLGVRVYGT